MDDARFIAEMAARAGAARRPSDFRSELLHALGRLVPFDSAILLHHPIEGGAPVAINKREFVKHHALVAGHPARYMPSLAKGRAALERQRGAYLDTDIYSARDRDRLPFYTDVVRPQGITNQIHARIEFRGQMFGTLFLCRHGGVGAFTRRDVDRLRGVLPALGVIEAACAAAALVAPQPLARNDNADAEDHARLARLSPRERTIAAYIARGLRNEDIAHALGTSPNTVRNQLAAIYVKVDASGRAELAALVARAHLEVGT